MALLNKCLIYYIVNGVVFVHFYVISFIWTDSWTSKFNACPSQRTHKMIKIDLREKI